MKLYGKRLPISQPQLPADLLAHKMRASIAPNSPPQAAARLVSVRNPRRRQPMSADTYN